MMQHDTDAQAIEISYWYDPKTRGFYEHEREGAAKISQAVHIELITGQAKGAAIVPDDTGAPVLVWPAAPTPTPEQIRAAMPALSPRQFWLAASRINITKADVLAQVDAMTDKQAASDLRIEITETVSFQRSNPAIDQLATLLGIPPEELDSLWTWAAGF